MAYGKSNTAGSRRSQTGFLKKYRDLHFGNPCADTISLTVDAPIINEFPLCLECEYIEYQDGKYGCGVIGRVVNVTADESVMAGDKIDMTLVNAIAFDPYTHGYYRLAERVGGAFKDGLKL